MNVVAIVFRPIALLFRGYAEYLLLLWLLLFLRLVGRFSAIDRQLERP